LKEGLRYAVQDRSQLVDSIIGEMAEWLKAHALGKRSVRAAPSDFDAR